MKKTKILPIFSILSTICIPISLTCCTSTNLSSTSNIKTYKITFDKGEADYLIGSAIQKIRENRKFGSVEQPTPIKSGYDFVCWKDSQGTEYTNATVINNDVTLFPDFKKTQACDVVIYTKTGYFTFKNTDIGNIFVLHDVEPGTTMGDAFKNQNIDLITDESSSSIGLPKISPSSVYKEFKNYQSLGTVITSSTKIESNLLIQSYCTNFQTCEWSEIGTWATKLENKEITQEEFCYHFGCTSMSDFIGLERTIKINNQDHIVRVVGTAGDDNNHYQVNYLSNGTTKAALTFEFATVISDSNGQSIGTFWNRGSLSSSKNYDYLNSTVYKCLEGNGSGGQDASYAGIKWYQAGKSTTTSDSTIADKSILEMLPTDLKNVIKQSLHYVNRFTNYEEKSYTAGLFLPTAKEMGCDSTECELTTKVYKYYYNSAHSLQKYQSNISLSSVPYTMVTDSGYSEAKNYAGFKTAKSPENGIEYWLSSPKTDQTDVVWAVNDIGEINQNSVQLVAVAVAPMFCI